MKNPINNPGYAVFALRAWLIEVLFLLRSFRSRTATLAYGTRSAHYLSLSLVAIFAATPSGRAATVSYGTNLVTNGNFETSNVYHAASNGSVNGFVSQYTNIRDFWNLTSEACYAIAPNPSGSPYGNPYFPNGTSVGVFGGAVPASGFGDRTTGSGLMMIVNGASDTTKYVWQLANQISVFAGRTYRFEAWTSTFGLNGNPGQALAEMRFEISLDAGNQWQQLGRTRAVAGTADWQQTYVDGQFATSTNVLLRLMNNQPAAGGNDFALDDIFFGEVTGTAPTVNFTGSPTNNITSVGVPEPSSASLVMAGIGGLLALRRSRKSYFKPED